MKNQIAQRIAALQNGIRYLISIKDYLCLHDTVEGMKVRDISELCCRIHAVKCKRDRVHSSSRRRNTRCKRPAHRPYVIDYIIALIRCGSSWRACLRACILNGKHGGRCYACGDL